MKLQKIFTTNKGEFELVVIKPEELKKESTTSDILNEAIRRRYKIPTKTEAYSLRHVLGNNVADVIGVWILVAIYKNGKTEFYKHGATIVSGILHDNEGSGVPNFGKHPNHKWEPGIAFIFFSKIKRKIPAVDIVGASLHAIGC